MGTLEVHELCNEYAADEKAANARYGNVRLKVRGRKMFAGENQGGDPIVMFTSPENVHVTFSAVFSRADRKIVDTLGSITSDVFVEGTVQPKAGMIVELRDCEVDFEATNAALLSDMQAMMDSVRSDMEDEDKKTPKRAGRRAKRPASKKAPKRVKNKPRKPPAKKKRKR